MDPKNKFLQGLTYDDILILPGYTDFSRSDIDLTTQFTRNISLKIPFVSSPMDTVTKAELAIALGQLGGIGIIHRNLAIEDQAGEVQKVKREGYLVGAAIGSSSGFEDRIKALSEVGVDVVVIDSAHGYTKDIIKTIKFLKDNYPQVDVIAGSIATGDGAKALIEAGVDGLRVGMGPGAICTTRIISGMGVPQVTALQGVITVSREYNIPVIADGGIKYSGDMVKALALGASTVMMGSFFAQTEESPGDVYELTREEVPQRFQSIFDKDAHKTFKFKSYRGMGSEGAMKRGADVKSEDEFHGKDFYKERVLVAEGVEGLVPVRGTVSELLDQAIGGIKSGMFYVGAKTISELSSKAQFIQVTQASLTEGHPHGIIVSNAGKSYQ